MNPTQPATELAANLCLPCPFCGGNFQSYSNLQPVRCAECEAIGPMAWGESHIIAWNRRAPLRPAPAVDESTPALGEPHRLRNVMRYMAEHAESLGKRLKGNESSAAQGIANTLFTLLEPSTAQKERSRAALLAFAEKCFVRGAEHVDDRITADYARMRWQESDLRQDILSGEYDEQM